MSYSRSKININLFRVVTLRQSNKLCQTWHEINSKSLHISEAIRKNIRAGHRPGNISRWHLSQTWQVAFQLPTPARAQVHRSILMRTPCDLSTSLRQFVFLFLTFNYEDPTVEIRLPIRIVYANVRKMMNSRFKDKYTTCKVNIWRWLSSGM
jgi:hypothetical protein